MFINALEKMSAGVTNIIYIAQITFKLINNVLLINERWFDFCHFDLIRDFSTCKHWAQLAVNFLSNIG